MSAITVTGLAGANPLDKPSTSQTTHQALITPDNTAAHDVITFTENQFMALFECQDVVKFPANRKIVIHYGSINLLNQACIDLTHPPNIYFFIKGIMAIFNDIFLPLAKNLTLLGPEDKIMAEVNSTERFLSLKGDTELIFGLQSTRIKTNIRALFERLSRANVETLYVRPMQKLILKVSREENDSILNAAKNHKDDTDEILRKIHEVFLAHLPEEFEAVDIHINGGTERKMIITENINDKMPPEMQAHVGLQKEYCKITLACDQGFSIKLTKRAQPPA